MKIKILLILILICQFSFGQKDSLEYKESTFISGIPYRTNTKSYPKTNTLIDVFFFKKNYHQFYFLPSELINKELKNQIVEEWAYDDRPKDWNSNWTNTYEYDSDGKLISYSYSGCKICSQFNYKYELKYNQKNQIVEQVEIGMDESIYGKVLLEYDAQNNIIKLEKYNRDKETLELIIERTE